MAVGTPKQKRLPKGAAPASKNSAAKTPKMPVGVASGDAKKAAVISAPARVPVYSIKVSKKGLVWVHVTLPRGCPPSVINIDAKPDGFHLDTGKWGGGWALDALWPEGVKVDIKEGEEVEAELNGGQLRACFRVEGAVVPSERKSLDEKGKQVKTKSLAKGGKVSSGAEPKPVVAGPSANSGAAKAAPAAAPKAGAKRARDDGEGKGGDGEGKKKQKKVLVDSKEDALKLMESVAGKEEGKVQDKVSAERERLQKINDVEAKREERRNNKKQKKVELVKKLTAKPAKKSLLKSRKGSAGDDEEEEKEAQAPTPTSSEKKRRVSWGTDQVRKFSSA